MKYLAYLSFVISLLLAAPALGQNCSQTSVGFTPLDDLGAGSHMGSQGGLYPGAQNVRPAAHETAGLAQAAQIVPRDAAGNPDPAGTIVFLSVGMSNARQEFGQFVVVSDADPLRAAEVVVFNGAQGGVAAEDMDDASDVYWSSLLNQLTSAGLSPAQVQAVWLKNANRSPSDPFPQHAQNLQSQFESIVQIIRDNFVNARVCYVASRIYAGYATTTLNPEPYAYESGFSMKWMIEAQINGDPDLNYDPNQGPVEAPWLAWGPYLWADGLVPRSDGLTWECAELSGDGTHPSQLGREKVANLLLDFVHDDPTASWYLGSAPPVSGPFCDASDGALAACPCANPGDPDTGCDIPQGTGGVHLALIEQQTSPNRATLAGSGFSTMGSPTVIVIRSNALLAASTAFGDGVRCIQAPLVRLAASNAVAGSSSHVFGHGAMAGAGDAYYQLWFRSQPAGFCTPDAFNLSNGQILTW